MRKLLLGLLAIFFFAAPALAKTDKVTVAVIQLPTPYAIEIEEAFHKALNSFGFLEGQNLDYVKEIGEAETTKYENNREIAQALLKRKPDVLVTIGTGASSPVWPLLKGGKTPMVYIGVTYPVQSGLIQAPGVPTGENITGISYGVSPEMRLKIFRTIFDDPKRFRHLAFVYSSVLEQELTYVKDLQKLKNTYGFDLHYIDFYNPRTHEPDFSLVKDKLATEKVDIIFGWYSLDDLFNRSEETRRRFLDLQVPIMAITSNFTDAGAIGGILTNHFQLGAQGAEMAVKVLSGVPAGQIPPEEPREYLLEINLKKARALKIVIPEKAIKMAYRLIQ